MEERGNLSDIAARFLRTIFHVCGHISEGEPPAVCQAVALLCDRECSHLETGICKDLFEAAELSCVLGVKDERFHYAPDNSLFDVPVSFEGDKDA